MTLITKSKFIKLNAKVALLLTLFACGAVKVLANEQPAKLFTNLPANCPTPDAFAIAPDNTLTLSCPNFANNKLQGELFSLTADGQVSHLLTVPTLNLSNKANPMGIAYDDKGALYVADSRGIKHGRILKLTFDPQDKKKLLNTEVIASGVNPNGLRYHQGAIYITQLNMPKVKSAHTTSAIYRFDESSRNLKMLNTLEDKEIIFSVETLNPNVNFGLDGLAFGPDGNLYAGNLGDSEIYKLILNNNGKLVSSSVYAKLDNNARIDGMAFDEQGNLYLAGFGQNQIFKVDQQQKIVKIADYPDNDGSDGQIDQPADLIVFEGKLIISNFDLMTNNGLRNTKHSKPYTLSFIELN
ncbi:SMP-30/gluconolactonase/LRE family protein [Thalassotalea agariperforans]